MKPAKFVQELRELKCENTFNPYSDTCDVHDLARAPELRSKTLLSMLEVAVDQEIDAIWIGRDLGYRGGRRTGLALTDDIHINEHARRWELSATRPTRGVVMKERTAAIIWSVLSKIEVHIFLWNVFPLHPYISGSHFSNRMHNAYERKIGERFLFQIIQILKPRRLIAIGNDAAQSARRMGYENAVIQVRHPSYGGQSHFLKQLGELYGQ